MPDGHRSPSPDEGEHAREGGNADALTPERTQVAPSPRLLVLLFLGLGAVVPVLWIQDAWPIAVLAWGLVGLAFLFDALIVLMARPRLGVHVPPSVGVGDPFVLDVRVELRHGPLRARIRPELDGTLGAKAELALRAKRGESRHKLELKTSRRGPGEVRALWSEVEGPLRLARRIDRHAIDRPVDVIPSAARVRALALAHFGAQPQGGSHLQKRVGEGGELDSLEPYQAGMDLRKVDWKSSARHQDLRVRSFRVEQNQRVILCADTGRLMGEHLEGVQRLDHAIHAMLLLSRIALKAGDQVGVQGYDSEVRGWAAPKGGIRQLNRLRRTLGSLHATATETNHVLGVHHLLARLKRRSLIVIFTEFSDGTTAELMVEYLAMLARRHLVVFVALDDPAIGTALDTPPKDRHALATAVVAGELRRDRERVLRRLRRSGVDVVAGPPGPAALRLLERYVRIKRRGLIG